MEYPMWYLQGYAEEIMRKYYMDKYYELLNTGLADGAEMGMVGYGSPPSSSGGNNYHTKPDNAYKQLKHYEKIAWPERFGDDAFEAAIKAEAEKTARKLRMGQG